MKRVLIAGFSLAMALSAGFAAAEQKMVQVKGSDTLVNLSQAWAEAFTEKTGKFVAVTGGGSGTGIAALIDGRADVANSSREIKPKEIELAKAKGINPVEIAVAVDGLSVIVNAKNPIKALKPEDIGRLFRGEITNWKQLGGNDAPVTLYGRQPNSGTYVFFQEHVLGNKDYAKTMNQMNGNAQILEAVAKDPSAAGYVGVGYVLDEKGKVLPGIKPVDVIGKDGKSVSPLDRQAVKAGKYSLGRALYQYTNGRPKGDVLALIQFQLSPEGQKMAEKEGFDAIAGELVTKNQAALK
ncbi:MAG: phosphate ABC transporter substrate-binding protein [Deltaproteobacteria bacterium]|nr:phosphate ABC transporter substrate-binding protein [Deltaproteobacteria bacterium]